LVIETKYCGHVVLTVVTGSIAAVSRLSLRVRCCAEEVSIEFTAEL
jgi:hypothetical protein